MGVVVDAGAAEVPEQVLHRLSHVVEGEDVLLARSREELARWARRVLEHGYDTVFVAGGDPTFTRFVTALLRQPRPVPVRLPRLGLLPLGGGKRLATLVGASGLERAGLLDDVLRARAGEVPGCRRVDLLEAEGRFAPFVGAGPELQGEWERGGLPRRLGLNQLGRLVESASVLPPALTRHPLSARLGLVPGSGCEVRCGAGGALLLGPDGAPAGPVLAPGTLLFRGRARRLEATSVPALAPRSAPLFPAGPASGRLYLGVEATSGALPDAGRLPHWSARTGGHVGFLASEVTLHLAAPMPVQVGGEDVGARERLHFRVVPEAVELCDFTGRVH